MPPSGYGQLVVERRGEVVAAVDVVRVEAARDQPRRLVGKERLARRVFEPADRGLVGGGRRQRVVRREARRVELAVDRDKVAEMVVGGVERIGSAQHVAARCYEVAVGELHGVRIADAEGELVQPLR